MTGRLLYDPDCGFCTRCAAWLEGRGLHASVEPITPEMLQASGIDEERALREIPFVSDDGTVTHGAAAIGRALATGPQPLRTVGLLLCHAPVRWLANPVYRWVATHRHELPGGTAACRMPGPRP